MLGAPDRDAHRVSARDRGLRRISRLTGWIVAASVVMTGALAKLAADAFGGKSSKPRAAAAARPSTTRAARWPPARARRSSSTRTGPNRG